MDIKFQGTIQLTDGLNTSTYFLPDKGVSYGKTGIIEKDLARRVVIQPGPPQNIDLGGLNNANFLCIITDQDITFTNSTVITGLQIKADKITGDKTYGIFMTTALNLATPLVLTNSGATDANVDIYLASV